MTPLGQMSRRKLLAVAGLAAISGPVASCNRQPSAGLGGAVRAPSAGRALFGAYISPGDHAITRPANSAAAADFGRQLHIAQRYVGFDASFPDEQEGDAVRVRQIPMITWQPDGLRLGDIAAGRYDAVVTARAMAVAALKAPMFLRFAHEMNGTWYTWGSQSPKAADLGNTPEQYIAAWRHLRRVFDAAGARNVSWVWCPNALDVPGDNDMLDYYPGGDVVDWLGLDVYATDAGNRENPVRQSFAAILDASVPRLPSGKPLVLAEFGFSGTPAFRAHQFASVPTAVARHRQLRALVYFDRNTFSPQVTPAVLSAARSMASSPQLSALPAKGAA